MRNILIICLVIFAFHSSAQISLIVRADEMGSGLAANLDVFDLYHNRIRDSYGQSTTDFPKYYWQTFRGVNGGTNLKKQDIADLKNWNANLLRVSMATMPLMDLKPPYSVNSAAFAYLDSILVWCEPYGISVVIDPHVYPGMGNQWTMLGNDSVWLDFKYHRHIIELWDAISRRYKEKGMVIAAYDILNEPETREMMDVGSPNDINLFYQKVVEVIRKNDPRHTISLALPRFVKDGKMQGYHKGIALLKLPIDDNLVLQSHSYMPESFSHQNVWTKSEFVHYPGLIEGELWDIDRLRAEQNELITFSRNNPNMPILIGEFSCPMWTGRDGIRYLNDLIRIAEENNWSWAYHSYRESHVWNAELGAQDSLSHSQKDSLNHRLILLKNSFKSNPE